MAEQQIEFSMEDRSRYVRSLYAFEANDNTQLTINPGDILEVFYRDDSGWWDGKNISTQKDGYFPGNYTEALGDNLDIIKQQLLYEDEEDDDDNNNIKKNDNLSSRSNLLSLMKESGDTSIDIRNAEPLCQRCSKCIKNDCNLCTIHCRALFLYIPFCRFCNKYCIGSGQQLDFEYDAYIFRSLSTIQHTLCIFGASALNHFISSLVTDFYNTENKLNWISHSESIGKTVFIRFIITIFLTICYILFLFLTSNTALQFLKQSPNNKQSTNKRDRNRNRRNMINCFRNISWKCGECGIKSCRPYTFIYTQFIMLLCSYILAFLWQDLSLDFQSKYIQNNLSNDWYKNIIFIIILLLISFFVIFLLKRKLNSVYHIYRYYSKQARDNINNLNLQLKQRKKNLNNNIEIETDSILISPLPKSLHSVNNNNDDNNNNVSRPYQVSLYLYFWCLLTEITLFMFALPLGSCFAAYCYWLLSSTNIWNNRATRIITMILYIIAFLLIYISSWRVIHIAMNFNVNRNNIKKKNVEINKRNENKNGIHLIVGNNHKNSISNTTSSTNMNDTDSLLQETATTQSTLTIYSSSIMIDDGYDHIGSNNEMIAEYESDIPDFIVMILMKYYGTEIESTEFSILSTILIGIFFCDIFIIGCWFNLWMLFDDDTDPFNYNIDNTSFEYNKYLNPSTEYLLYVCILTILLPFICSYLFGKTFKYFCCRKNNYKLSIILEVDKLWMKSLLSRWFILIQSLILGYLWCSYFQVLWYKHIDPKYYTLSTGLWAIIVYIIIFIVIIIFKLNKKLLRLLWTMHDDEDDYNQKHPKIIKKILNKTHQSGVGNLGLNASVKEFELEKKLGRRMISHNTIKAKKAKINLKNNENNNDINHIEIIKPTINNKQINNKHKTKNKMSGLSTSLLQSDDEDDAQIL